MFKYISFIGLLFLSCGAYAAEEAKLLGEYGDWSAWMYNDKGNLICYMTSMPKKDEGKYTKRGDIYTVITHRPHEKSFDEVSFVAGYTFDPKAPLTIKIGKQTFKNTFTDGGQGWMINTDEDHKIVMAMKRGDRMIVDGKSSRGTLTKDTYSLKGFTTAYQTISAKCNKK